MCTKTILVGILLWAAAPAAYAQDCGGTGLEADCDNDTFTIGEGDCDDTKVRVNPGRPEVCGDQLDNNCDGFFDEECDGAAQLGSIRGGGSCTGGSGVGGTAFIFLAPLFLFTRRRGHRS
ncbi:MAG: hypothetical protein GWP91_14510 [Rhodobacterales bacterium]|nr:hypothetical protein [Rhodobacterales bacterium]